MTDDFKPDFLLQHFLVQITTKEDFTMLLEYIRSNTKEALLAQLELAVAAKELVQREEDDPLGRQLTSTQLRCMRLALRQRDAQ